MTHNTLLQIILCHGTSAESHNCEASTDSR
jgi:hypothetical protein